MGNHNTWETLPWITGGLPIYSYTNEFQELVPSIGARAEANLSFDSAISQSYKNPAIIGQLEAMIAAAKASEQNFLSKYNLNRGNLNDWSNLVKSFNKFLGNEESFRRNLQLLKQTEEPLSGRKGTYTQLETFFSSYVQKVARRKLSHVNFNNFVLDEAFMKDVINSAVKEMYRGIDRLNRNGTIDTYSKKNDRRKVLAAYKDMIGLFNQYRGDEFFGQIKEVLQLENFLKETAAFYEKQEGKRTAKGAPTIVNTVNNGEKKGALSEIFGAAFATVAAQNLDGKILDAGDVKLYTKVKRIGRQGVKADVMMAINSTVDLDELLDVDQQGMNQSKRVNAIENYEKLFAKLKDAKADLVFISNKNWKIDLNFRSRGGFGAQDKNTTLANVGSLLSKVGSNVNVEKLINTLSNCGESMILGTAPQDVLRTIATQIGYFLFDDLSITMPSGINAVHLFNLSGVYMPLSLMLQGVLDSIKSTLLSVRGGFDGMVKVSFKPGGPTSGEGYRPWSEDTFSRFRKARMDQSRVEVFFLRDFASFITSKVKI